MIWCVEFSECCLMVLIECGCAGSSESVWHCALADSPLQGLPKARSNPTTQSAPVVWEGGLLLLALGTVTGETLRSQFHSAHFFETSGSQCRHKASSTSRIRSYRLVPCCVLIFLVMKCSLCFISSDLLRTSSFLLPVHIQVSFSIHLLFLHCPSLLPSASCSAFETALG